LKQYASAMLHPLSIRLHPEGRTGLPYVSTTDNSTNKGQIWHKRVLPGYFGAIYRVKPPM
jgi:hypothetical protein